MFDFDAGKLIIIGIVALIVIGPKELPGVLRQVGQAVAKMRRMAAEFQGQFMEAMREADVADIKSDVAKLAESAKLDVGFNPVAQLKNEIKGAIQAAGKPLIEAAGEPINEAAGKPAIEAEAVDAPALGAPYEADSSLNAFEAPRLPEAAADGAESLLAAGIAPAAVAAVETVGAPAQTEPVAASGVEAEMKALAHALEAEMRAPARRADAETSKPKDGIAQDLA